MPLVLIDGSNAWYRAYCANPGLSIPGGPMLIFSSMLRKLANQFGKKNLCVCWDSGDGGRKELDSEYKSQRVAVSGVWEHLPLMAKLVSALGIATSLSPGYEGDDVIGSLCSGSDRDILIVSYDRDFYQLVSNRVKVFRPARKIHGAQKPDEIIGVEEAKEEFGCVPEKIPLLKSFLGDNSDNLPKLPLRMTANFKKILLNKVASCNSLEDFFADLACFESKHQTVVKDFENRAKLSHELLKIKTALTPKVENPPFNAVLIQEICDQVEIKSLKIDEWRDLEEPEAKAIAQSLF